MFIAALFTVTPRWRQPNFPFTDEWVNKEHSHTMEYYLAVKISDVLIHTARQVNCENIRLRERSQTQEAT